MKQQTQKVTPDLPLELHSAAVRWAKDNESSVYGCIRLALRKFLGDCGYLKLDPLAKTSKEK